jgi:hypothetical protein
MMSGTLRKSCPLLLLFTEPCRPSVYLDGPGRVYHTPFSNSSVLNGCFTHSPFGICTTTHDYVSESLRIDNHFTVMLTFLYHLFHMVLNTLPSEKNSIKSKNSLTLWYNLFRMAMTIYFAWPFSLRERERQCLLSTMPSQFLTLLRGKPQKKRGASIQRVQSDDSYCRKVDLNNKGLRKMEAGQHDDSLNCEELMHC